VTWRGKRGSKYEDTGIGEKKKILGKRDTHREKVSTDRSGEEDGKNVDKTEKSVMQGKKKNSRKVTQDWKILDEGQRKTQKKRFKS